MLCRPFGASSHATRPHIFVPTFEIQFKNMKVDNRNLAESGGKTLYMKNLSFIVGVLQFE